VTGKSLKKLSYDVEKFRYLRSERHYNMPVIDLWHWIVLYLSTEYFRTTSSVDSTENKRKPRKPHWRLTVLPSDYHRKVYRARASVRLSSEVLQIFNQSL